MFKSTSPCNGGRLSAAPHLLRALAVVLTVAAPLRAFPTDVSSVPLPTYSTGSTVDIKPNILMVLDDSGSMDWNYMPDWANDRPPNYSSLPEYLTRNSGFNGLSYNPAITYLPPVKFNSDGTKNTTSYPSMTGMSAATGADSSTKPNWKAVPNDGFGVQSTSTTDLVDNAYFYTTVAGEYCNAPGMTSCTTTSSTSGNYAYPAILRWCDSAALTNCRALQDSTYQYPRMAAPLVATITISSATNAVVSGITVGGAQIMSGSTSSSSTASTVATAIRDKINACSKAITGNCGVAGYVASASGSTVTVLAPGNTSATPTLTLGGGSASTSATAFASSTIPLSPWLSAFTPSTSTSAVPGFNLRTVITSGVTSYPYPGTNAKATTRTDCAGATCTYTEEMTNYANWFAYYRTRMQMMKTSTALAFSALDSDTDIAAGNTRYRVGYLTINNNTANDFVNVTDFNAAQKVTWFSQLFAAVPNNSTPLRRALSTAGRLYGGKLNGTTLNGTTVTDPLQYSCQKNFTILSTDGFWNGNGGLKLDGTTTIGNEDGLLPRPYSDGATVQARARTSQLQQVISTQSAQKGTLQKQTSQLQKRTSQLQKQTSQLQKKVTQLQKRAGTQQKRTSSNGGLSWGSWNDASSCSPDSSGSNQTQCQVVWDTWSNASSCSTDYSGKSQTDCQTLVVSDWSNASSCSAGTSGGQTTSCQYVDGAWADAGSCTALAKSSGPNYTVGTATSCQYVDQAWANATSCTAVAKSTSPNYTVGQAISCQSVAISAYANSATCSEAGPDASGISTQCRYNFATAAATPTCSPAYTAGDYTNPTVYQNCSTAAGTPVAATTCTVTTTPDANGRTTSCQYSAWSGWSNVASCTAVDPSTGPTDYTVTTARECSSTSTGGTSNTLADVAAYYYNTDLRNSSATGTDATGTCTGPIIPPATTANDLCANNVPSYGRDVNTKQHMTTHTLGLGAQGRMIYSPYQNNSTGQRIYAPDYWTQPSGDFYAVANGSVPSTGVCSWMASGNCTWPTPAADSEANIDDLWHAAVNGHGTYFSAADPQSLADALKSVLAQIVNTPRPGTAAAAASSNPNITSSDNYVFSSSYRSVDWYGEMIMQRFNADGTLTAQQWSAMRLLDCSTTSWQAGHNYVAGETFNQGGTCYNVKTDYTAGASFDGSGTGQDGQNTIALTGTPITRTIYTVGSSGLTTFTWGNLTSAQQAYFSTPYINYTSATDGLTQFCSTGPSCMGAAAQTSASGQALVDFLRGSRTNEGSYFRVRKHVLGDIVSSEGRYVKQPLFGYADAGYADFKTAKVNRAATVYVGANDGMLHAFDAVTGNERWAFIPSAILPEMYRLADTNYENKHRFFVDGTPEVGDVCPSAPTTACAGTDWRTILVGGLNLGGKAFYALDITDPANPTYLWEFGNAASQANGTLGYSFSNPRIAKLSDGTWVVVVASGYNNTDGVGRLYVINAYTGALIRTISTAVGTADAPSGLTKITARGANPFINNTIEAVYGGDLLGNVWRFDVNNNVGATGYDAQLLVSLTDAAGHAQPITQRPTAANVGTTKVVIVGTGKYLGLTDLTDTQTQSIYAIKDNFDGATLPGPRTVGSHFIRQTLTETTCPTDAPATVCTQGQTVRTATSNPVDWGTDNGWYLDFLSGGERAVTDPSLALGTLAFTTIRPQTSNSGTVIGCSSDDQSVNAKSSLYYLDYKTGGAVEGTKGVVGEELCACVATRPSIVKTQSGTVEAITRMSGGTGAGTTSTDGTTGTDQGQTNRHDLPVAGGGGAARRVSWRELNGE